MMMIATRRLTFIDIFDCQLLYDGVSFITMELITDHLRAWPGLNIRIHFYYEYNVGRSKNYVTLQVERGHWYRDTVWQGGGGGRSLRMSRTPFIQRRAVTMQFQSSAYLTMYHQSLWTDHSMFDNAAVCSGNLTVSEMIITCCQMMRMKINFTLYFTSWAHLRDWNILSWNYCDIIYTFLSG